ncbi:hypothetical protein W02_03850 [Nitrospira sp. KM1]|uniref:hypothetical protein n=1 Tax=Nitrospira sp. KM1 TaxID=1936990 RepID=UPI0013A73B0C|nr:hypothetical protein [Nitrospira sp. KM1]BCA53245.1 hypothetical protein W02_03850 [Nitrospira sp. KM1]
MKILCMLYLLLGYSLDVPSRVMAHSADEVMKTLEGGPIPKELVEATKNLEATAGQKSSREDTHARQHELLEQYVRLIKERKCKEAIANIAKFDAAIVGSRNQGNEEEENRLRQVRDKTAAFVKEGCADTSASTHQTPLQ